VLIVQYGGKTGNHQYGILQDTRLILYSLVSVCSEKLFFLHEIYLLPGKNTFQYFSVSVFQCISVSGFQRSAENI